jgi:hypothetical protein
MNPPLGENHTLTRHLAERKLTGVSGNARPWKFRKLREIDGLDRLLNDRIQAGAKNDCDFGLPIAQLLARFSHWWIEQSLPPVRLGPRR